MAARSNNFSAELKSLQDELGALKATAQNNQDAFFNVTMALVVFLMQCGFAFLEAGAVRSKNTTNIIIKNVLDSLIAIIAYSFVGWALAYGTNPYPSLEPFFGFSEFALNGTTRFSFFFFQFVFAATASTIISGAVAERAEFVFFLTYSTLITLLTHWGWTSSGWMSHGIALSADGATRTTYIDFAGSGMVHVLGGTISLIAAWMIGPRIGRFPAHEKNSVAYIGGGYGGTKTTAPLPEVADIRGHSVPLASLGGFILMFGFLAFNGGSTAEISSAGIGQIVAKAMTNTIMCGAFAALAYLAVHRWRHGKWTVLLTINACLSGMVSACAGCNQMRPWMSVFVGSISGMFYLAFAELCLKLRVDDPLDAFGVHFGGGLWGLIAACIFTDKGIIFALFGSGSDVPSISHAFIQFGWQMVCVVAIILWSAITTAPAFFIVKKLGLMRIPREVELRGMDIHMHGEAAYPMTAYGHGWEEEGGSIISSSSFSPVNENGARNGKNQAPTVIRPIADGNIVVNRFNNHYYHPTNGAA